MVGIADSSFMIARGRASEGSYAMQPDEMSIS